MLIVDDSSTMRSKIRRVLTEGGIEVVGEAANVAEAHGAIAALRPDVLTLDVEMPGMGGLEFLAGLMAEQPMPVVMISSYTRAGADATIRALELGAVDCVGKPRADDLGAFDHLATIVRAARGARPRPIGTSSVAVPPRFRPSGRVLAVGASTGGVEALLAILGGFPANCPPTLITQHMPAAFTASLAERLDRGCAARVSEARDGAPLVPGQVYLAPGGVAHLELAGEPGAAWTCRLRAAPPVNSHRPSVDALFTSVAAAAGAMAVGIILTGMGRDGAQGLLAMRQAGGRTFGQDEESSVIYGMPRAALELGGVQTQVPLSAAAATILAACQTGPRAA